MTTAVSGLINIGKTGSENSQEWMLFLESTATRRTYSKWGMPGSSLFFHLTEKKLKDLPDIEGK